MECTVDRGFNNLSRDKNEAAWTDVNTKAVSVVAVREFQSLLQLGVVEANRLFICFLVNGVRPVLRQREVKKTGSRENK